MARVSRGLDRRGSRGGVYSPLKLNLSFLAWSATTQRGQLLFGDGAAAETPGGAHVFGGGDLFETADGGEIVPEGVTHFVVCFLLAGENAGVGREKAEAGGVAGGFGFAFFGFGAGGVLGVAAIGVDLRLGGHVFSVLSGENAAGLFLVGR